jgi:hypothetical protein
MLPSFADSAQLYSSSARPVGTQAKGGVQLVKSSIPGFDKVPDTETSIGTCVVRLFLAHCSVTRWLPCELKATFLSPEASTFTCLKGYISAHESAPDVHKRVEISPGLNDVGFFETDTDGASDIVNVPMLLPVQMPEVPAAAPVIETSVKPSGMFEGMSAVYVYELPDWLDFAATTNGLVLPLGLIRIPGSSASAMLEVNVMVILLCVAGFGETWILLNVGLVHSFTLQRG